jgi:hypothetical protein
MRCGRDFTHHLAGAAALICNVEWVECPAGIAQQIQGHAPQGVREQNYIRRPVDLLRVWHDKIEAWILKEANVSVPRNLPGFRV